MYKDYFSSVNNALERLDIVEIEKIVLRLKLARSNNKRVWIVGNGGSAATASHFANDLIKIAGVDATAVHEAIPTVLAFGNDTGWENMYSGLIGEVIEAGDILIAISCSGNSMNVVNAASLVGSEDLIVFTGDDVENRLAQMKPGAIIFVRDSDIRVQEDVHLVVCHSISGSLKPR